MGTSYRNQRIRDPLHDLIEFEADEFDDAMWRVIQTRPFQRLRRVKQLGFSEFVYPGATHSRFAHSVGVFHTSRRLMKVIAAHLDQKSFKETQAYIAMAAALVHDLGHGPFSHSFEEVGRRLNLRKMQRHELVSEELIRDGEIANELKKLGSGFANDVAAVIGSKGPRSLYDAVVSSQFDADRLDYMQRDRLMTGTQHAAIDFEWLVANLQVGEVTYGVDEAAVGTAETFVLGPKAAYAAEAYVLGLFQLYPTVYLHKATRGAEKLFTELMTRVVSLIRDGSGSITELAETNPIYRFGKNPEDIEYILSLDDTIIWAALASFVESKDRSIRELAIRLRDRKLFKCIDIRERVAQLTGNADDQIDRVSTVIIEKVRHWQAENPSDLPRIVIDEAERTPYKKLQESKNGVLNQIRIQSPEGALVDLGERSAVVKAIRPFKAMRIYCAEEDYQARQYVEAVIKGECDEAGKH